MVLQDASGSNMTELDDSTPWRNRKLSEFDRFLRGTKLAESLSPELRDELHVPTAVEELVMKELLAGRNVVLAGSAGSGKTHLLRRLKALAGDAVANTAGSTAALKWDFVEDATALMDGLQSEQRLLQFFHGSSRAARSVVAINHGVLLALARSDDGTWVAVRDALHAGQKGRPTEPNPDVPLVVDVEGLSPAKSGVVGTLLRHDLLQKYIDLRKCGCGEDCPRVLAWTQLSNDEVVERLNELIEFSEAHFGTIRWGDIWQFIQDLLLSGTCNSDIPTSTWFYQVFFGSNRLSTAIRETINLDHLVFPTLDSAIWYSDWLRVTESVNASLELLPLAPSTSERVDSFQWMKAQLFFTSLDATGALSNNIGVVHPRIHDAVRLGRPREIVRALNSFMSYGHNQDSTAHLVLWTDFGVQRQLLRPTGQVALGRASTEAFQIASSRVAANPCQDFDAVSNSGSSRFLLHVSGAALPLETWLLRLLNERRSPLQSRRDHSELEWHVRKFYAAIADSILPQHSIEVLHVDFKTLETTSRKYGISGSLLERLEQHD